MRPSLAVMIVGTACIASAAAGQAPGRHWLDATGTPAPWNTPGAPVPAATPAQGDSADDLRARCGFPHLAQTAGERAVGAAGWLPFHHLDRALTSGDIEVVGGMAAAGGRCQPAQYNLFVFVGGRFAGTLSPVAMTSASDGTAGAVRLLGDDLISAEFARYQDADALCCPSSRVSVRYHVARSPLPVVTPLDARTTRGR